jgi:hypothetical protein
LAIVQDKRANKQPILILVTATFEKSACDNPRKLGGRDISGIDTGAKDRG